MYLSQIPSPTDVNIKLANLISTELGISTNTHNLRLPSLWNSTLGTHQHTHTRFGSSLSRNKPTPSKLINPRSRTMREAIHQWASTGPTDRREDQFANETDEFYHWLTNFRELPQPTKENIIIRITHPLIVFSYITQLLVRQYNRQYGMHETKLLLKESCVRWDKTATFPLKFWGLVYKLQGSTTASFNMSITDLIRNHANLVQQHITTWSHLDPAGQSSSFLCSHSTQATDTFNFKYGKTPSYTRAMGIELELDNLRSEHREVLVKYLGDHAIFKRDSSVSNGVEICTAPATLDIHKKVFKTFFTEQTTTLVASSNCGLHIHVDKKGLQQTQISKILCFMSAQENNIFIENIAGRTANTYCRNPTYTWEEAFKTYTTNKYHRVNLCPKYTIEFRLFASTTNFKQFSRCLEFTQAILDYTMTGEANCSIKDVVKHEHFVKYVNAKHQFYPELYKFINNIQDKEPRVCA